MTVRLSLRAHMRDLEEAILEEFIERNAPTRSGTTHRVLLTTDKEFYEKYCREMTEVNFFFLNFFFLKINI